MSNDDDDKPATGMNMNKLPNELVTHILSFLYTPSYFEGRLRDDPKHIIPSSLSPSSSSSSSSSPETPQEWTNTPIKAASLVNHVWRRSVLHSLFRNVVWKFNRFERPTGSDPAAEAAEKMDFLQFLRRGGLNHLVDSLTIVVEHPIEAVGHETLRYGLVSGTEQGAAARLSRDSIGSGTRQILGGTGNEEEVIPQDNNWLWHALFQHLDPKRFTIIAYPAILASLLSKTIFLDSAVFFDAPYHILSLSRPTHNVRFAGQSCLAIPQNVPSKTVAAAAAAAAEAPPPADDPHAGPTRPDSIPCDLFGIRDWTSMLLNEGSSINVYGTYEYFNHTPPSLLSTLLHRDDTSLGNLRTTTLTDFSYIAIFPLSTHISGNLVVPLPPALRKLYVQLVPRESLHDDIFRRPTIDASDLWMERNIAYSNLMTAMFSAGTEAYPWGNLEVFETGDATDKEAWEMAVQYVEEAGNGGWKVAREGVFVRIPGGETEALGEE